MQNLLKISVGDQCQAMLTWFIALSLSKSTETSTSGLNSPSRLRYHNASLVESSLVEHPRYCAERIVIVSERLRLTLTLTFDFILLEHTLIISRYHEYHTYTPLMDRITSRHCTSLDFFLEGSKLWFQVAGLSEKWMYKISWRLVDQWISWTSGDGSMDVMILLECQDPRAVVAPLVIIEAGDVMIHGLQKVAPSKRFGLLEKPYSRYMLRTWCAFFLWRPKARNKHIWDTLGCLSQAGNSSSYEWFLNWSCLRG